MSFVDTILLVPSGGGRTQIDEPSLDVIREYICKMESGKYAKVDLCHNYDSRYDPEDCLTIFGGCGVYHLSQIKNGDSESVRVDGNYNSGELVEVNGVSLPVGELCFEVDEVLAIASRYFTDGFM